MKIFIGNLGGNIDSSDLRQLFSGFGPVEDSIVPKDRYGDSRGFGYVVMASERDARYAISTLNKKKFKEQFLSVSSAIPDIKVI